MKIFMNCEWRQTDYGPCPYATNVEQMARNNRTFRTAIWTGCNVQMTLMCIPPCGEIGLEMHEDTDQIIRVEQGQAIVQMGECRCELNFCQRLCRGDVVFVPAGTWHNIKNMGRCPLKLSSVYAPPNHARGTVHCTKEDAEQEEHM